MGKRPAVRYKVIGQYGNFSDTIWQIEPMLMLDSGMVVDNVFMLSPPWENNK